MTIDKQALREEFQCMQDHYSDPADRDRQIIYIAAEALLDENIQLRREKDVTEAVLSAMRDDMRQAREQLKAAEHTAAVDHEAACSLVEENEELKRKLEAENQRNTALTAKIEPMDRRIAELERSETQLINERDSAESALNDACRAAMLQGKFRDLSQPVDPQISEYEKIMLQAGNSPVIPDGYVFAPIEPTSEMIKAALKSHLIVFNPVETYSVMLAAAPKPELTSE